MTPITFWQYRAASVAGVHGGKARKIDSACGGCRERSLGRYSTRRAQPAILHHVVGTSSRWQSEEQARQIGESWENFRTLPQFNLEVHCRTATRSMFLDRTPQLTANEANSLHRLGCGSATQVPEDCTITTSCISLEGAERTRRRQEAWVERLRAHLTPTARRKPRNLKSRRHSRQPYFQKNNPKLQKCSGRTFRYDRNRMAHCGQSRAAQPGAGLRASDSRCAMKKNGKPMIKKVITVFRNRP